jgi:hypothetical protein
LAIHGPRINQAVCRLRLQRPEVMGLMVADTNSRCSDGLAVALGWIIGRQRIGATPTAVPGSWQDPLAAGR